MVSNSFGFQSAVLSLVRRHAAMVMCLVCGMVSLGCQPKTDQPAAADAPASSTRPAVSNIPLRVWIAAPVTETELIQRQWIAQSEQPLELRSLTVEELLAQSNCECDVLVYPASLIGELVQRGWIVKQPQGGSQVGETASNEQQELNANAAWRAQGTYADEAMGLSLGCAVPVFVASAGLAEEHDSLTWNELLSRLKLTPTDSPSFSFDSDAVDTEAVVDRFLSIVATLSMRDPGYGMLFDLQSMQSRLNDAEYIQAAEMLAALAGQTDGLEAVIGSHSAAWAWATTREIAAVAIAAPILLDAQAAAVASGRIVKLQAKPRSQPAAAPPSSGGAGAGVGAGASTVPSNSVGDRPQVAWWGASGGLLASMSSRCRQSGQAQVCLEWLQSTKTRTVLSTLIPGIEAGAPSSGNEALSWQAQRQLSQDVKIAALSLEPRLPLAHEYRRALADELQQFLSGKKNSTTAMQDAARRWNEITQQAGAAQRRNYEQSLNL